MTDLPLPERRSFCMVTPEGGLACGTNFDGLTGCWNFRTGQQLVEQLRAGRGSAELVLLEIDVHLTEINETHGHVVGDDVLRVVGARLRSLPSGARAYRSGGATFVVPLLVDSDRDAEIAADVLLAALGRPVATRAGAVQVPIDLAIDRTA